MRGVRAHLEGVDAVVCGHVDEHLRRAVGCLKKERVALRNVHLGSSRDTDQQRGCGQGARVFVSQFARRWQAVGFMIWAGECARRWVRGCVCVHPFACGWAEWVAWDEWHGVRGMRSVAWEAGHGMSGMGPVACGAGHGKRDAGNGMRGMGWLT
jgi:hypothetical protein